MFAECVQKWMTNTQTTVTKSRLFMSKFQQQMALSVSFNNRQMALAECLIDRVVTGRAFQVGWRRI